nr:hypothetical protein [uncultured Acetatifactor sp.]
MNIEIEDVCPAKPKFEVGDVVTIPEASPDETYVIKEAIDFGPSTGIVYEIFAPDNTERIIQFAESGLEFQYHDVNWEHQLMLDEEVRSSYASVWKESVERCIAENPGSEKCFEFDEKIGMYTSRTNSNYSELFEYTWDDYIPESVTDKYQFFSEMAEIYPRYNRDHNIKSGGFKVCVYEGDEGPIPHVHVYYEHKEMKNHGNTKTVAYVCLGTAEYAPQHRKETKELNSKERKALVKFFSTEIPNRFAKDKKGNLYPITCWEECVQHWIDENPGSEKYFEVDEETGLYSMPDYSELC